jgi:two-component system chemotaxis sensor kinase CheA
VSGKPKALLVDELLTKQEVVIKNLGGFLQELRGVAGGAILGDGNIALILDPGSLFQAA